jgi:hypothetical protein
MSELISRNTIAPSVRQSQSTAEVRLPPVRLRLSMPDLLPREPPLRLARFLSPA